MSSFAIAQAVDGEVETLVEQCIHQLSATEGHTLGFLYVTDPLVGSFEKIVSALKAGTGVDDWVGTVGYGICASGGEYFGRPAIVALTCNFDGGAYQIIESTNATAAEAVQLIPGFAAGFGVVHGDPRNGEVGSVLSALAEVHSVYLVGGLSSSETSFPQVARTTGEGGVSGVLLGGRLEIAVGLTQGCSPIGPTHVVTQAEGQVLATLDDRPAFEVLREDLGVADGADATRWLQNVHAALPVDGSNQADYLVRNLVGIEPNAGLVVIADEVPVGEQVMFVRRDEQSATDDMQRMVKDLRERISKEPRAGLYYSCVARGSSLFAGDCHEMTVIAEAFGDIPIVGFFGNGEIADDRIYAYTGVLTLFL